MTGANSTSLTNLFVSGSGIHGINAASLSNLTLTSCWLDNNGNGDNEHGLNLTNVSGTISLNGSTFNGASEDLVHLENNNTNVTLNVTGSSQFSYPATVGGFANSAILLLPGGTSAFTANIQNATFTNIRNLSAQIGANTLNANGTQNFTFSNNTITVNTAGRAAGVLVSGQELTTTNITINDNNFSGAGGNGVISIDTNDSSTVRGTANGNTITNPPGIGIFAAVDEAGKSDVIFNGNTITNSGGDGIQTVNFGGVGVSTMDNTITNNIVNGHSLNTAVSFVGGIGAFALSALPDAGDSMCFVHRGNNVTGTPASPTQCGGAPCVDHYIEEVAGEMTYEENPNTGATTLNAAYVNSINDAGPVNVFGFINLTNGATCNIVPLANSGVVFPMDSPEPWQAGETIYLPHASPKAQELLRRRAAQIQERQPKLPAVTSSEEKENLSLSGLSQSTFENETVIGNNSFQTPSEILATLESFVNRSETTKTIPAEASVAQTDIIETSETNDLNFISELTGKLFEAISPTVYSQVTAKTETPNIAGETVTVNGAGAGFTLPAGKSITVTFRATVNNTPIGLTQVSTQGTVSGGNFANVLTNDPATGTPNDATVTLIDSTTITVSSSQNPSITGQSVTFTATLTGAPVHATGDPSGTVQFFDNGVAIGAPQAVSAGAENDNTGTATFTTSSLTAGSHPITATFSGGGGFNANNTSNTLNQTVGNTAVWDGSASADWNTAANWTTNGVPSLTTNDISIPAAGVTNNPTISASDITVNNLTLAAGRTLTINSNRTLNIAGVLTMNGNNIDASSGVLALGTTATIVRTSGSVLGNFDKSFGATGAFVYHVGTATGYSPVNVNITALATNPSTLRVRANDGTAAATPPIADATSLDRYWTLTETGDLTANVVFNYLTADVDGNENNYKVFRVIGATAVGFPNAPPCPGAGSPCVDPGANTITVNGLQTFSNWTAGELAPVAANVAVGGRIFDAEGRAVARAEILLIDANGNIRTARSNPFGYYRFEDVETGANYTINITHKQYQFTPQIISVTEDLQELNFTALPE